MSSGAKIRVNREEELALFERIVSGDTPERVLLVEAASGMGKSELLREYGQRRPPGVLYGVLDFKGGDVPDLAELFSRLCARLGWPRFPRLSAEIASLVKPSANISENKIIGRAEISVALSAPDEETRRFRRAALTEAFLADLCAAGQAILVFDTFNRCNSELAHWVSGFIARACNTPRLTIIVAGQSVPEPTLEWESSCYRLTLNPITAEHWLYYAKSLGLTENIDFIRGCWHSCGGHSLKIAELLESLALQGSL
jgi:hypothetical protein